MNSSDVYCYEILTIALLYLAGRWWDEIKIVKSRNVTGGGGGCNGVRLDQV